MSCSPEEFVRLWQSADSPRDVAEKAGISVRRATSRACLYRRRGIRLKKMAGLGWDNNASARLDVEALNRIIDEEERR